MSQAFEIGCFKIFQIRWITIFFTASMAMSAASASPLSVGVYIYLTADEQMNVAYIKSVVEVIVNEFTSAGSLQHDGVSYDLITFPPPTDELNPCMVELEGLGACNDVISSRPDDLGKQFDITIKVDIRDHIEATEIFIRTPDPQNLSLKELASISEQRFKEITLQNKDIDQLQNKLNHLINAEVFPVINSRLDPDGRETLFANCVWARGVSEEDQFALTALYSNEMSRSSTVAAAYVLKSVVGANYEDYCGLRGYLSAPMGFPHEIRGFMFLFADTLVLQLKWQSLDGGNVVEVEEEISITDPNYLKNVSNVTTQKLRAKKGLN